MADGPWLPDGRGIPAEGRALIAEHGGTVHLRLTSADGRSARGGCDGGLGEWWSGVPAEVDCPACLEVVHA